MMIYLHGPVPIGPCLIIFAVSRSMSMTNTQNDNISQATSSTSIDYFECSNVYGICKHISRLLDLILVGK